MKGKKWLGMLTALSAIEFRVGEKSTVTNIPLMNLPLKKDLLLSFINRNGKIIIIPSGQDCIKVGDTVMIVTSRKGYGLHVWYV